MAAALLLAAGLAAAAGGLFGWSWGEVPAPFPYAWLDVAVVQLGAAVPLAVLLTAFVKRRLPAAGLAALGLGAGALTLLVAVDAGIRSAVLADPPLAVALRAALALGLAVAGTLTLAALAGGRTAPGRPRGRGEAAATAGLAAAVWLLVPATYVGARCRHDAARLGELLEQSRFGEARVLARGLLALDPGGDWRGAPYPRVTAEFDRLVRELEARAAGPLPERATAGERLVRARHLAMLGRTEAALEALETVREPAAALDADALHATIRETRGEWDAALALYQKTQGAWEARPPSADRTAGLTRALTGVAYCRRKAGRYAEAEAAYRQLLALSPTAETHFLLAQFYEDAQQTDPAREHARAAIALDPARYRADGEALLRKLAVFHFGCLGVYHAERSRPAPHGGTDAPPTPHRGDRRRGE